MILLGRSNGRPAAPQQCPWFDLTWAPIGTVAEFDSERRGPTSGYCATEAHPAQEIRKCRTARYVR
jgi:hypothetical protein